MLDCLGLFLKIHRNRPQLAPLSLILRLRGESPDSFGLHPEGSYPHLKRGDGLLYDSSRHDDPERGQKAEPAGLGQGRLP